MQQSRELGRDGSGNPGFPGGRGSTAPKLDPLAKPPKNRPKTQTDVLARRQLGTCKAKLPRICVCHCPILLLLLLCLCRQLTDASLLSISSIVECTRGTAGTVLVTSKDRVRLEDTGYLNDTLIDYGLESMDQATQFDLELWWQCLRLCAGLGTVVKCRRGEWRECSTIQEFPLLFLIHPNPEPVKTHPLF